MVSGLNCILQLDLKITSFDTFECNAVSIDMKSFLSRFYPRWIFAPTCHIRYDKQAAWRQCTVGQIGNFCLKYRSDRAFWHCDFALQIQIFWSRYNLKCLKRYILAIKTLKVCQFPCNFQFLKWDIKLVIWTTVGKLSCLWDWSKIGLS